MDDVDITMTMDDRSTDSQQSTNIEVSSKPFVFRASYRDLMLISTIVNKAIALYGNIDFKADNDNLEAVPARPPVKSVLSKQSRILQSQLHPVGHARVIVAKEQVRMPFVCKFAEKLSQSISSRAHSTDSVLS